MIDVALGDNIAICDSTSSLRRHTMRYELCIIIIIIIINYPYCDQVLTYDQWIRKRVYDRKWIWNKVFSASIHESTKIRTAIPLFLR